MKKLLLLLLCVPLIGIGQQPFWSDDLSNASLWTMTDYAHGGTQNWVIGTAAPTGYYSLPMGAISSSTAANGFAMYDSDALANSFANAQDATLAFNNSIDCSAYQYVDLSFESYHRVFHDSVFVEVSNDNVNWERYQVHADLGVNDASDNPELISVNISATAGNQATVWFRFRYEGEWDYAWMLDDVSLAETPDNDASISDAVQGGWWANYANVAGGQLSGLDYTFNTNSQLTINPYSFEAVLHNNGVGAQTMVLNAEVFNDQGTSVFTSTSNTMVLDMSHSVDTFVCNNTFTPNANGAYEMRLWGIGDSVVTDTAILYSHVNDYIYGRDNNIPTGSRGVARDCGGMVLGTTLDIYANETVYALQVHIDAASVVGTPLYVAIYENSTDPAADPIFMTSSDDYILTANDLDNWITVPFTVGQQLYAGTSYLAAVGGYASPTDTFKVNVSGESQSGCYIQDNGCDLGTNPFGTWYTISEIPMIRMSFSPNVLITLYGCTDSTAINYNPTATTDDGSCIYCNISSSFYSINPTSSSSCDGFAMVNTSSSYPIVSYNWTNSLGTVVSTNNSLTNLCNDVYIVTITDSAGCTFVDTLFSGTISGCTDSLAVNYNPLANTDDGSCIYPIYGCTNSTMFNYNPLANTDDGSCIPYIYGCTDILAYNYNSLANTNNGSCQYCDLSISQFIVVQNSSPSACDGWAFATANTSNGPITYSWSSGSTQNNTVALCSGTYTLTVTDAAGCTVDTIFTIGSVPIYGCTDPTAINYDPTATVDDGSCTYSGPCSIVVDTANITHIACPNGGAVGAAQITQATYLNFSWQNITNGQLYNGGGGNGGTSRSDLDAGFYVITGNLSVLSSCPSIIYSDTFEIKMSTVNVQPNPTQACPNQCNVSASINLTNTVASNSYFWKVDNLPQNTINSSFSNLCGGSHTYEVFANGQSCGTENFGISQLAQMNLSTSVTNVTCTQSGSANVNITGFGASALNNYCLSSPQFLNHSTINNVSLVGDNNSITNNTSGICNLYSDFTAQSADVIPGNSYTLDLDLGFCDSFFVIDIANIFVDWNIDGDFDDNNELIAQIPPTQSPSIHTINFMVPINAIPGQSRMRVVMQNNQWQSQNQANACDYNTAWFGETEDYTIVVTGSVATPVTYLWSDGQTTQTATNLLAGTYNVTITDANGCSATETAVVSLSCNGCTDSTAINYNPLANIDDGSCTYVSCGSITGVNLTDVIHDRVTFNWDNMNSSTCDVDQIRFRYREVGTTSYSTKTMGVPVGSGCNTSNTSKLVLGLTPSTTYEYDFKIWYCNASTVNWHANGQFTTAPQCDNVINVTVTPLNNVTKADFCWDSVSTYAFVRLKYREDVPGSSFNNIGGMGVLSPTLCKEKGGITPGLNYRVMWRTWCSPNGGPYRSPQWDGPVTWTQPNSIRVDELSSINSLEVYPNPSRDVFNVSFTSENKQSIEVRLVNLVGEIIFTENLEDFEGEYTHSFNLSEYSKGIYLLELDTDNGIVNKKLILQ